MDKKTRDKREIKKDSRKETRDSYKPARPATEADRDASPPRLRRVPLRRVVAG